MVVAMSYFVEGAVYMNYEAINQWIIPAMWIMVGIALCAFGITLVMAKHFNKEITKNIEAAFKKYMYYLLDIPYTVFIVLISLVPLLGMLGTVSALLTLDITGATEGLKANFFQALDTTGLGLICAIVGKLINAFFQPHIERSISKAKKLLEKGWSE